LQQNPSVRQSGEIPLTHFYSVGAKEGREPIPLFDVTFYLEQNPDVLADGINPLLHYILHRAQEGRNPHSLFDTKRYLAQNPDVATSGINPLVHYVLRGSRNLITGHALLPKSADTAPLGLLSPKNGAVRQRSVAAMRSPL
jgi:hypothetical protein